MHNTTSGRLHASATIATCGLIVWVTLAEAQRLDAASMRDAQEAMQSFLDAWLIDQNEDAAMQHFAVNRDTVRVSPRRIWSMVHNADLLNAEDVKNIWRSKLKTEYWTLLTEWAADDSTDRSLATMLAPINTDLAIAIRSEGVAFIRTDPFTAFVAEEDMLVESFDGGYGDVSGMLQASENAVVTMIVDFTAQGHAGYNGPFVAFWKEDAEDGAWRIHALGGAPEAYAAVQWRDPELTTADDREPTGR